jgi:hypothetical protein
MMQPLRVPPRFEGSLRVLAALPEDEFASLLDFLNNQEQLLVPQDLGKELAEHLPQLAEQAGDILGAAVSLSTRVQHDPDAAQESAEGVSLSPELDLPEGQRPAFVERLAAIMRCHAVQSAAKALDLVTDYDHVYYGARILTDIRPVFSTENDEVTPVAAVVIANLKIEHYGPSGDITSFHVALDHGDLLELRDVVQRGLEKTKSSKEFLEEKSMRYLQDAEGRGND